MPTFVQDSLDEPHVLSRHLNPGNWETSPYFRYARGEGFIDMMTYFLIWSQDYVSGFGMSRLERHGVFTEREIALGGLLLPHLRRSVTISKVLDAHAIERERMAEALDALKCAVVLANRNGAILHANRAAERTFRHGWSVLNSGGLLSAKLPAAAKELRTAIRLAAQNESALGNTGSPSGSARTMHRLCSRMSCRSPAASYARGWSQRPWRPYLSAQRRTKLRPQRRWQRPSA
jgi:hypothetical protein